LTERLYQEDTYRTDFDALVVAVSDREKRYAIELDRTIFYPESGGQPCDTGAIGGIRIDGVIEEGGSILHIASSRPSFSPGERVKGTIDWRRRFTNMQQHTGQHVLSQAFLRALGAATVSSRLSLEHSTIDVSAGDLAWDDVKKTEDLANAVVFENREVLVFEARKDEVEGLRMKMPIDLDVIRVVEVKDFDRSPCGGTHTRTTGEIGPIKILRWERVRDTTRVEFVCGVLAMDDYFWKNRFVVGLAQDLTTKDRSLPVRIPELLEERKELAKEVVALGRDLARYRAGDLWERALDISGTRVAAAYLAEAGPDEIRDIAGALTERPRTVALLASGAERLHLVFSRSSDLDVDMREAMQAACEVVGGKGGGKPGICRGGGVNPERAPDALKEATRVIEKQLGEPGRMGS
jgi:alanyl-tRNA synthetase